MVWCSSAAAPDRTGLPQRPGSRHRRIDLAAGRCPDRAEPMAGIGPARQGPATTAREQPGATTWGPQVGLGVRDHCGAVAPHSMAPLPPPGSCHRRCTRPQPGSHRTAACRWPQPGGDRGRMTRQPTGATKQAVSHRQERARDGYRVASPPAPGGRTAVRPYSGGAGQSHSRASSQGRTPVRPATSRGAGVLTPHAVRTHQASGQGPQLSGAQAPGRGVRGRASGAWGRPRRRERDAGGGRVTARDVGGRAGLARAPAGVRGHTRSRLQLPMEGQARSQRPPEGARWPPAQPARPASDQAGSQALCT